VSDGIKPNGWDRRCWRVVDVFGLCLRDGRVNVRFGGIVVASAYVASLTMKTWRQRSKASAADALLENRQLAPAAMACVDSAERSSRRLRSKWASGLAPLLIVMAEFILMDEV
jgi:hypothetical protein